MPRSRGSACSGSQTLPRSDSSMLHFRPPFKSSGRAARWRCSGLSLQTSIISIYSNLHFNNACCHRLPRRMHHYIYSFMFKFIRGSLGRYTAGRIARQLKSLIGCHRDKYVAVFTCARPLAGMAQYLSIVLLGTYQVPWHYRPPHAVRKQRIRPSLLPILRRM